MKTSPVITCGAIARGAAGVPPETAAPAPGASDPGGRTGAPGAEAGQAPLAGPASPGIVTAEQVRAGLAEARGRQHELLRPEAAIADPSVRQALLERWGVEVHGVRQAARGYMIDFRFRVLDADKALPLFDRRTQPYLVREGSDVRLPVPAASKVGAFRPTNRGGNIQSGRDYHMVFGNPDAYVKPGARVSVVIGDFRADGLTLR